MATPNGRPDIHVDGAIESRELSTSAPSQTKPEPPHGSILTGKQEHCTSRLRSSAAPESLS